MQAQQHDSFYFFRSSGNTKQANNALRKGGPEQNLLADRFRAILVIAREVPFVRKGGSVVYQNASPFHVAVNTKMGVSKAQASNAP